MSKKISQKTAKRKRRGKGVPFKAGESGNPSGRPPLTPTERELRDLFRAKAPAALARIEAVAKGGGKDALKADEYIVDRGYGRPRQEVEVSGADGGPIKHVVALNPKDLTDEQLRLLHSVVSGERASES